jgi:RND family efflux transporter MFP subunit
MSLLMRSGSLPAVRQTGTALAVGIVVAMAAACGGGAGDPASAGAGGRGGAMAVPVEILTLAEKPVEQAGEFVGTVRSLKSMTVQSQVEGFITKINVKSGDRVAPGTVLFDIDASSQQAVVANLESLRAAREADLSYAKQQVERAKKLFAAGAMSQQELDQATAQQTSLEATLKAVEEQIRQQRNELGYSHVTAATAGVVGDVPVRTGDRITRQTQLTTIEDNTTLELYLNVPVQDATRVKLGQVVHLLDDTGKVIDDEKVSFISPSVDDDTQTVLVKTPINTHSDAFRSRQFVRARLVWSTSSALTVPLVAVTRISGQFFVFAADPGPNGGLVAHQKPVVVGDLVGNDYVVQGGLKAGDRVIVAGIQKIGEGAPVQEAPKAGGRGGPPSPAPPASAGEKK